MFGFPPISPVHIPTEMDDAVKEYIRMRDDGSEALTTVKQQIIAFCTRRGKMSDSKGCWTKKRVDWLRETNFDSAVWKEIFQEYMILYFQLREKVDMYEVVGRRASSNGYLSGTCAEIRLPAWHRNTYRSVAVC